MNKKYVMSILLFLPVVVQASWWNYQFEHPAIVAKRRDLKEQCNTQKNKYNQQALDQFNELSKKHLQVNYFDTWVKLTGLTVFSMTATVLTLMHGDTETRRAVLPVSTVSTVVYGACIPDVVKATHEQNQLILTQFSDWERINNQLIGSELSHLKNNSQKSTFSMQVPEGLTRVQIQRLNKANNDCCHQNFGCVPDEKSLAKSVGR